ESSRGGNIFGGNFYARATSTAATSLVGAEVDVENSVNGTATKVGFQVVDIFMTLAGTVSGDNVGYALLKNPSAVGFAAGVQFGATGTDFFPITSTGSMFKAVAKSGGSTVANIFDFTGGANALTVSGNILATTNVTLTGAGALTLGSSLTSATII